MSDLGEWVLSKFAEDYSPPTTIVVGPVRHAQFTAYYENLGRDRRRIKREVNRAVRKAQALIGKGFAFVVTDDLLGETIGRKRAV